MCKEIRDETVRYLGRRIDPVPHSRPFCCCVPSGRTAPAQDGSRLKYPSERLCGPSRTARFSSDRTFARSGKCDDLSKCPSRTCYCRNTESKCQCSLES